MDDKRVRPVGLPPNGMRAAQVAATERDKAIIEAAGAFTKLCDAATAVLVIALEERNGS